MKFKFQFNNLTNRMLVGVTLLQLVLFPVIFGGLLYTIKQGYETQFIDHARSDAYILASTILTNTDYSIVEDALITGRIAFAQVVNNKNETIYISENINAEYTFNEDFYFGQHDDGRYNITIPLTDEFAIENGVIRLSYDESSTHGQINEAFLRGLEFALIYLIISVILTVMLGRKLTRPIQQSRELSRDIAHGQFQQAININTNINELSVLAETLEFMREELVNQNKSLEHQALHDMLTGLPNRALLHDRIETALYHPVDAQDKMALVLIDLDRFKEINDSFGHLTGDNVLMKVSVRLRQIIRRGDTVTRLGGDEFAILLPTADAAAANKIAEKMHQSLSEPMDIGKHALRIGASLGIVTYPEHGDSFESLLGNADIAMYAAKESGGGIRIFSETLSKDTFKKLTLASDLREAVDKNQFFTVFQPKLDLRSGLATSAEALVRWQHPEKGLISPADFIPIAEKTGTITSLTRIVLKDVIEKLKVWISDGFRFSVSVNLSAYDLENEKLADDIVECLRINNVLPKFLELEITESSIIKDPLKAFASLEKLHNIGIKIALDDFGTGYSSLAQLRRMPLSIIKIDRSFVSAMTVNDSDTAIVRATIGMAHELGHEVVAEGPEDEKTMQALKSLNCDFAQGYYVSKPLNSDDFIAWVEKNNKGKV